MYLPLLVTVLLILAPQPSLLILLVQYHYLLLHSLPKFLLHLAVTYTLTFCILTSLLVCVVRDPGPVGFEEAIDQDDGQAGEMSLAQALMEPGDDFNSPGRWCRTCWAPKPERAHHCSHCGRCVLKMDHHCPWLGSKCVGHRTYPAFVYMLGAVTLLATYVAVIAINSVWWSFSHPYEVEEVLVIHELILSAAGVVFSLVVGSFFFYHVYLITTNQTTLEHISPYILLRHLPPLPPSRSNRKLSDPPEEDELTYEQRRLVRYAAGHIRLYDLGWRRNWAQVFGWDSEKRPYGWVVRLVCGGGSCGNGRQFSRNPRADELLQRLANDLVNIDKDA
jgi:palmitoyltransferase